MLRRRSFCSSTRCCWARRIDRGSLLLLELVRFDVGVEFVFADFPLFRHLTASGFDHAVGQPDIAHLFVVGKEELHVHHLWLAWFLIGILRVARAAWSHLAIDSHPRAMGLLI